MYTLNRADQKHQHFWYSAEKER